MFEAPDDSHVEARLESAGHVRLDAPPESAATDASTTAEGGVGATSSPDTDDEAWPESRSDVWSYLKGAADVDALGISWQEDGREAMIQTAESAGVTPPEPEEEGGE